MLATSGRGGWGAGPFAVSYEWSLTDTSDLDSIHEEIGSGPPGVLAVVKVTKTSTAGRNVELKWIQYTAVIQEGKVYVPPPPAPPWPWDGIDTGARNDGSPYTNTPAQQALLDVGRATGWQGAVQHLYDPKGADSIFVDWASCGGLTDYTQASVVGLIGTHDNRDYLVGTMRFTYSTDAEGNMACWGGGPTDSTDVENWYKALLAGFGDYMKTRFGGLATWLNDGSPSGHP